MNPDFANDQAWKEREALFQAYCTDTLARAEKMLGHKIANRDELAPALRDAFDKGITVVRLAELLTQSRR